MKQCFGYVRVSTVKQGDGVSLEAQRDAIEYFAAHNDIEIVEWFEEIVTAAKQGRPLFDNMIGKLKKKQASGVVFHKIDRSARNFRDWAKIGDLAEAGIDVHFATETLDFNSRGGRLTADIQAVIAADYIRNLKEESIKGQIGRLKQGLYPYAAPVGYLNTGKGKVKAIDPAKAPLINETFKLYATGEHSYETLSDEMRTRGLTNTSGKPISKTGIEHILTNPFYMGLICIKRTGLTYSGIHEPIITPELYQQAESVRTGRHRKVKVRHDYLFRGLFRCAGCNRALIGEKQKGRVYYRCHRSDCERKSLREDQMDKLIARHLQTLEFSASDLKTLRQKFLSWLNDREQTSIVRQAPMELETIQQRLSSLTDKFVDDLIDHETYSTKKANLLQQQRKWQNAANSSRDRQWHITKVDELLERVKNLCVHYRFGDPARKRNVVRFACSNRMLWPDKPALTTPKWHQELQFALHDASCVHAADPSRTFGAISEAFEQEKSSEYKPGKHLNQ